MGGLSLDSLRALEGGATAGTAGAAAEFSPSALREQSRALDADLQLGRVESAFELERAKAQGAAELQDSLRGDILAELRKNALLLDQDAWMYEHRAVPFP